MAKVADSLTGGPGGALVVDGGLFVVVAGNPLQSHSKQSSRTVSYCVQLSQHGLQSDL